MDKLPEGQSPTTSTENETQEDEVPEKSSVDLPPLEFAISIDHILEHICSYLDIPELLNCRLVSHRFLKIAQVHLDKEVELRFFDYKRSKVKSKVKFPRIRKLSQLAQFIKQSSSSASKSKSKLISFPCTRFEFNKARLGDDSLQRFLNINGQNIRQLSICSHPDDEQDTTHEDILMDQLSNLLTKQAPNLKHLYLEINPRVKWMQGIPTEIKGSVDANPLTRSHHSPLLKTDPEYQQISSRVESLPRKSSLKSLEIYGGSLGKVMELIFQLSPKLQQVDVDGNNFYHYLLEPVSRIHLLRNLFFDPFLDVNRNPEDSYDYSHSPSIDTMEKFSMNNLVTLREIRIDFSEGLPPSVKITRELEKRIASSINRILDNSKDTLERLTFDALIFLRGMKFPMTMPKVRNLAIVDYSQRNHLTFFPKGFPLSETFPGLTCVHICYSSQCRSFDSFNEFLDRFDFQRDEETPVLSLNVTKVLVEANCFLTRKGSAKIPAFILEKVHKYFPSAQVKVSWDD